MNKKNQPSTPSNTSSAVPKREVLKLLSGVAVGGLALGFGANWAAQLSAGKAGGSELPPVAESAGHLQEVSAEQQAQTMEQRVNGRCGDKVSLLGFGCMRYPVLPAQDENGEDSIDEEMGQALVDYAMSHGINYYDTAWFYHHGKSEAFTGKALSKYDRKKYYLATKMPTRAIESLEQAKEIYAKQHADLRTDYFDYYLLHNLQTLEQTRHVYEELGVLPFLIEEKKKGHIRNLGWSFHGNRELFEYALQMYPDWDFVQIQLNYNDWLEGEKNHGFNKEGVPSKWMYDELTKRGIPVIVMEPLLGGTLASLGPKANAILKAKRPQDSIASWAFRFVGSQPNVLCVLSGMTYLEHLQDNLQTFCNFQPLSQDENACLFEALEVYKSQDRFKCTACNYCMPCSYGVNIPQVFAYYNRCIDEGRLPDNEQDPNYRSYRRAFLIDADRALPASQQARCCVGCGKCAKKCPQSLPIPDYMRQIARFTDNLKRQGRL